MNRVLSLFLSAAVALSPLAPPAAAEEVVISPLPIQGALVDPCAAGGDRAKCTGVMSAAGSGNVRGGGSKPVLYRRLQWREIDSRSITEDEYAALICKLNRENCDGDLRNPGVLAEGGRPSGAGHFGDMARWLQVNNRPHHVVLGLYDRMNNTLRIVISRIERGRKILYDDATGESLKAADGKMRLSDYGIRLSQAVVGPAHFDYLKATRAYLPAAQKADPSVDGINPFSRFDRGDESELFHNIDFSAAMVAVSRAQAMVGAAAAFVATAKPRVSSRKVTSRSLFRRTVKIYFQGHVKPEWMMLASLSSGGDRLYGGLTGAFCAVPVRDNANALGGNCPTESLVVGGSAAVDMTGGNMPSPEQLEFESLYAKKSGFSVLAIALIFAVVFAIGAYFLGPELALALGLALTPVEAAAIGFAVGYLGYLGASQVFGGASPGDYQRRVAGNKVNFGQAVQTESEFSEYGSASDNRHYRGFADVVSRGLTTRTPEKSLIDGIAQFWGGAGGAAGARGDVDGFVIKGAAVATRLDLIKASASAVEKRAKAETDKRNELRTRAMVEARRALLGKRGYSSPQNRHSRFLELRRYDRTSTLSEYTQMGINSPRLAPAEALKMAIDWIKDRPTDRRQFQPGYRSGLLFNLLRVRSERTGKVGSVYFVKGVGEFVQHEGRWQRKDAMVIRFPKEGGGVSQRLLNERQLAELIRNPNYEFVMETRH